MVEQGGDRGKWEKVRAWYRTSTCHLVGDRAVAKPGWYRDKTAAQPRLCSLRNPWEWRKLRDFGDRPTGRFCLRFVVSGAVVGCFGIIDCGTDSAFHVRQIPNKIDLTPNAIRSLSSGQSVGHPPATVRAFRVRLRNVSEAAQAPTTKQKTATTTMSSKWAESSRRVARGTNSDGAKLSAARRPGRDFAIAPTNTPIKSAIIGSRRYRANAGPACGHCPETWNRRKPPAAAARKLHTIPAMTANICRITALCSSGCS